MRPKYGLFGLILAIMALGGCAGTNGSTTTKVWKVDNPTLIGGHAPEVLGSPRKIDSAMQFDGKADGLVLPANPIQGWAEFTIEVLFKPETGGLEEQRFLHIQDQAGSRAMMEIRLIDRAWALDAFLLSGPSQLALLDRTKLHPVDRWTWVAMVYGNGRIQSYIDGVKELEGAVNVSPMGEGKISIGVRQNKVYWFKGSIREVRFHPTALPAEKLQRTKKE